LAWDESKGIVVEPFVGRGSALNRAIIYVLGVQQPQTTRQISKNVKNIPDFKGTSTSTVNKRVRDLEKHGYLKKAQVTQRVGGITNYYELTPQAHLNKFLDANKASELFTGLSGELAAIVLANLIRAKEEKEDKKP
jgi:DNA-binding PadR family transcriptional regulator